MDIDSDTSLGLVIYILSRISEHTFVAAAKCCVVGIEAVPCCDLPYPKGGGA